MSMEHTDLEIREFIELWRSGQGDIEAHTSGSTGTPKRILLPRRLVRESAWRSIRHFGLDSKSVVHLMLSPSYIAGKMAIVRALEAGCRLTWEPPSSRPLTSPGTPSRITLLSAVGAQLRGMEALARSGTLPRIRHLLLGGAPLRTDMRLAAIGLAEHVWESYGMTETASHIALRPVLPDDPYGLVPFTPLDGVETETDERSCLVITVPGAGRLVTNDIVKMHHNGGFTVTGRADNVIITGGLKVMPEQVEQALAPLMKDMEFYVTSRSHPKWGEEVILVTEDRGLTGEAVYTDASDYPLGATTLALAARDRLEPCQRPRGVMTLPALPRTESGKVIRRKF